MYKKVRQLITMVRLSIYTINFIIYLFFSGDKALPYQNWAENEPGSAPKEDCMAYFNNGDRVEMHDVYCTDS